MLRFSYLVTEEHSCLISANDLKCNQRGALSVYQLYLTRIAHMIDLVTLCHFPPVIKYNA